MVGRIGGRISVVTEWLGKQILDGFLRQFQTKARGTSTRKYNAKLQRKWYLTVLKFSVLLTVSLSLHS